MIWAHQKNSSDSRSISNKYTSQVQVQLFLDRLKLIVLWTPLTEEQQWEVVQAKTVYDEANAQLKFSKAKVTDFLSCRRITVPDPEDEACEVLFASMKEEIVSVTKAVMLEICDDKGRVKKQNNLPKSV